METKFNLYDLFAVFIPGATVLVGFGVTLAAIGVFNLSDIDWTATVLFLPVAYVTGTAIHQYTRKLVSIEGFPSRLLSDDDTTFTAAFKEHLWGKIQIAFPVSDFQGDLPPTAQQAGVAPAPSRRTIFTRLFGWWWTLGITAATPPRPEDEIRQMAFDLCYDCVIQKGKGVYTENMNALYGMCRNMLTVVFALASFATFAVACRLGNRFYSNSDSPIRSIALSFITLIVTWLVAWWFRCMFQWSMSAHAKRFVISVYRSFYLDRLNVRHVDK